MRKILLFSLTFMFLSVAIARAEGGIAVFHLQKVAMECDASAAAKDAIEKKFGGQKTELEKERAALEKKAAEYQKKAPTEKQRQDFIKQQREYSEKGQAFLRLLQADEQRIRNDIDTLMDRAAKVIAESKGYALVLDSAAVSYFAPNMDITDAMLAEINAQWKKEKGGTSAAPARDAKPASGK